MSLSAEAVNQSFFIAALFLILISGPKLMVLTVWGFCKVWLFRNLERVIKSKPLQIMGTSRALIDQAENPVARLETVAKAVGEFLESIRDPLIENVTSVGILGILLYFNAIPPDYLIWIAGGILVSVVVLIGAFTLAIVLWKDANRILGNSLADNKTRKIGKLSG